MDVAGAFNTVLRNRMTQRLLDQKWPIQIARWAQSFLTDRSAALRYEASCAPPRPLHCGIPQGSPVSPVLFMLFMAPLFHVPVPRNRLAYMDDVGLAEHGASSEETAAALTAKASEVIAWGRENAVAFEPAKCELVHFARRHEHLETVTVDGEEVAPAKKPVRWLGIYLDSKLTFRHHVEVWAGRALRVGQFLRRLNAVSRGAPLKTLSLVARAIVEPIATYEEEPSCGTAAPREMPANTPKKQVASCNIALVRRVERALTCAARAVVPAYKTTRNTVLLREAMMPPAVLCLDKISRGFALRLARLDEKHPLVARSSDPHVTFTGVGPFRRKTGWHRRTTLQQ